jgi:hypothetical protein
MTWLDEGRRLRAILDAPGPAPHYIVRCEQQAQWDAWVGRNRARLLAAAELAEAHVAMQKAPTLDEITARHRDLCVAGIRYIAACAKEGT